MMSGKGFEERDCVPFKVPSQNFTRMAEGNKEKPQST